MRAIVLDLDDTLYPHDHFLFSGFGAVARHVERRWGVPAVWAFTTLCRARFSGSRGSELQTLCELSEVPIGTPRELLDVFRAHAPELSLPPASRAALERLRHDGWRIGVLTNGLPAVQARTVRALGLDSLVDDIVHALSLIHI